MNACVVAQLGGRLRLVGYYGFGGQFRYPSEHSKGWLIVLRSRCFVLTNTLCHKIVHAACEVVSYIWVSAFYMLMLDERAPTVVLWNFRILRLILLYFVSNDVCVYVLVYCAN